MRINCKKREIKGFAARRQIRQPLLRVFKQLLILKSPPYLIIRRQLPAFAGIVDPVMEIVLPVFGKAEPPASKGRVRAEAHIHLIPLRLQNIAQAGQIGKERILGIHEIGSDAVDLDRNLQRQSAGRGPHAAHGPGAVFERIPAVQDTAVRPGEVFIFLRKRGQLRNIVLVEQSAAFLIRIGDLHRLQENIDQISLLFREGQRRLRRINVIVFNIGRLLSQAVYMGRDAHSDPETVNLKDAEQDRRDHADRKEPSSQNRESPARLLLRHPSSVQDKPTDACRRKENQQGGKHRV